ncbi:DUF4410 domain-containing protein [Hydrogenophaga pseudoflava]|uniref:DUF4410 domain-containing protein n=1 Tax=Hydrogenophaga pseudoflava TaxID=47421 RepID=UPI0027E40F29|nr:DUF4410 domain-containing protein [Hydrogenophaga pseudoflava]MDQ7746941.1 DUF4410 domain-containing protein [Hydrogenophaga pseudoflava]
MTVAPSFSAMAADAKAEEAPRKYTQAYVTDIVVKLLDSEPDEKRIEDKKTMEMKLPQSTRKKLQDEGLTVADTDPGPVAGAVRLKIAMDYDPGNRALRWVGGMFGAGKGTVSVKVEAVDAVTGGSVATEEYSDSKRMGGAGGDFYGFAIDAVDEALENLAEKLAAIPKPVQ